jgi:triacylglycerol lipase
VLLVPGFLETECSLIPMGCWLARIGYRPYLSGIDWNVGCSRDKLEQLSHRLEVINHENRRPVAVVGHSLGGMMGRGLAAMRPELVGRVITLGSPTRIALDVIRREARSALLGFQTLWRIFADPPHDCGTMKCTCGIRDILSICPAAKCEVSSIFTRDDEVVDWRACVVPGGDNYEVSGKHCSLVVNPEVYHLIAQILAKPVRSKNPQSVKTSAAGLRKADAGLPVAVTPYSFGIQNILGVGSAQRSWFGAETL